MIIVNGKTFRNLQEQVYYLTNIIGDATDIVKNVVGTVTSPSALPAYTSVNYGTTYAVGASSPYNYYVSTASGWVNLGTFPKAGASGTDGKDGNSIFLTSANLTPNTDYIYTTDIYNPSNLAYKAGDLILATNASGAYLYTVSNVRSSDALDIVYRTTLSGIQGPKGDTGPQGPKGDTGPQGPKGEPGTSADVVSIDFPYGQETVGYNTTDGITLVGQSRLTDSAGATSDVATDIAIPIFPGQGIGIDAKADGTGVEIKNTDIIALGYSTPDQSIVSTINNADISAKYDDYDNVISTTYATKTELPVYKTLPEAGIYSIDNNDIVAKYDETGNIISTTYATKTELNNKLDKTTSGLKVYATDDIGNQTTVDYTDDILPSSIPLRNTSGNLAGNAPIANNDYTTKSYVDNKAEAWTFTLDDGTTVVKNVLVN